MHYGWVCYLQKLEGLSELYSCLSLGKVCILFVTSTLNNNEGNCAHGLGIVIHETRFINQFLFGSQVYLNVIMQKSEYMHKKDGSSVRPKTSMLEKALRELEKMVAECKFQVVTFTVIIDKRGKFVAINTSFLAFYSKATCSGKPGC